MIGRTDAYTGRSDFSLITWGGGTNVEITNMVKAHYNGTINISDYWKVGDTRYVHVTGIPSGTTGESHDAQTVQITIIGINHDTLATKNGTRTKAAITVQTKKHFKNFGYVISSNNDPSYALWSTSERRTWCNNDFISALPSYLQNLIKPVTKYTNRFCSSSYSGYSSYRTHTSSTESCFLLSEWEVFGKQNLDSSTYGSLSADGTQYEYMKTDSHRDKSTTTASLKYWFTRTGYVVSSGTSYFMTCRTSDYGYNTYSNTTGGIAPAFCL